MNIEFHVCLMFETASSSLVPRVRSFDVLVLETAQISKRNDQHQL